MLNKNKDHALFKKDGTFRRSSLPSQQHSYKFIGLKKMKLCVVLIL